MHSLTPEDVAKARERIVPHIRRTPLLRAERMEERLGCRVYLKPEMFQITGSFKLRGALNMALSLPPAVAAKGLIGSSSGNHAQALAYAGRMLGVNVVLVVPCDAPRYKVENTRALGAEVILFEGDQAARWAHTYELAARHGYTLVHAFDEPLVMAGQGTIALEILEDLEGVDTLVVPLGGGGLVSGIAVAAKALKPGIRIIGVEPALAPKYHESRKRGGPVSIPAGNTVADGVKAGVPGKYTYPLIERYVDTLVLAEEKDIVEGLRMLAQDAKLYAEGAAAVGIGALLGGSFTVSPDEKVCFVLSAGNWGLDTFMTAVGGG